MSLEIYNRVREVPQEAQKTIGGGRLKGMTDINPMWRIKTLTEVFGPAGIGWYYKIKDKRLERGANDEIAAFVDIDLFVKCEDAWSMPIEGTGGAMFVEKEKNGLHTSDECYKMALTDAISVACKALGFGADVYWSKSGTKYDAKSDPQPSRVQALRDEIRREAEARGITEEKLEKVSLGNTHKKVDELGEKDLDSLLAWVKTK